MKKPTDDQTEDKAAKRLNQFLEAREPSDDCGETPEEPADDKNHPPKPPEPNENTRTKKRGN